MNSRDHTNTTGEINLPSDSSSTFRDADNGAHERNRTADLLLTMQMLYRLSYVGGGAARSTGQVKRGPSLAPSKRRPWFGA
jgi:hypothetical protein